MTMASFNSRYRWSVATVMGIALLAAMTVESPRGVEAASLHLRWDAPTTNASGSPLTDLAGYIVYVATSTHACFGRSFFSVPSPVAAPAAGDIVEFQVSGLEAGTTYAVAVSALNQAGFESDCSPEATGAARTDFTVTPSRIDFGSTSVGTAVDRVFTVTNVGNRDLSVTVAGSAPFTIVSGPSFTVAPGAARDVTVRFSPTAAAGFTANINFTADDDTLSRAVTATASLPPEPPPLGVPSLTVTYTGMLRDRVGPANLGGDGSLDGTLTATLRAPGGRTITRLRLQSSAPGTWDTDAATPAWVLGADTALDGALLNDPATMAVNFAVADGGSFQLFAADFAGIEFAIGVTLRLTATFSDGTTATAVTVATAVVPTNPPSLALTYNGLLQDRVAPSSVGVAADGALDGTLTATLSAPGGRTITRLQLHSSAPATWDTNRTTGAWVLGVATTGVSALLNDPVTAAVNFVVADGGSFTLFAAELAGTELAAGVTLTLTATFSDGTTATAVTVRPPDQPSLAVSYNGKIRDRVGQGNLGLGADGALDGTFSVWLSAPGGRTITRLQLRSSTPDTWDTDTTTSAWVLGVATTLDGALLNDPATMAVNFRVADGDGFQLFAADWADVEFVPGTTLTVTATFSDGTTASGTTVADQPTITLSYDGKLRDRVQAGNLGLGADGALDGTLTVTLSAAGGRTITRLQLRSSAPGSWDTDNTTSAWVLGVATKLDKALLNDPATMAVNFRVFDGGSFRLFAADFANIEFVPGTTLTVTAVFSDGTTASGTTIAAATPAPPSLTLSYDGKLRDRVQAGNFGLGADGALDGTFTVTLSASGGRTITRLQLRSSAPGSWDTDAATSSWLLGVAGTLDGVLLNDPATVTVNFAVADGGSFRLFAADFANIEFVPGTTLTVTAVFSDGTTASGTTIAAATPAPPSLTLSYDGKLRDRVQAGNL